MWLVFLLLILFLGMICSKIEISLKYIEILEKKIDFKIQIRFKLFGLFPICILSLTKLGILWGNHQIAYPKLFVKKAIKRFNSKIITIWKNLKLDEINFTLKIGLIDVFLTNNVIVFISILFPMIIRNKGKRKNWKYEILPEYDKLKIHLSGTIKVSVKSFTLLKSYFQNIRLGIGHNKNKNGEVKESL